jgi:hypothetical protein
MTAKEKAIRLIEDFNYILCGIQKTTNLDIISKSKECSYLVCSERLSQLEQIKYADIEIENAYYEEVIREIERQ